jgi:glycerol-3-phosphate dehydrogenase subunit B
MRDTIVIGAGLAGLMGALALAEAGRRPLVLATGHGATHWGSGTIDVWGQAAGGGPRSAVAAVIAGDPDHPYARTGVAGLEAACARFRQVMQAAAYPFVGDLHSDLMIPTALGAFRRAALVPRTMSAGALKAGDRVLIAGFRQFRDFYPPLMAQNLRSQGIAARGVYLELPPVNRNLDFTTRSLAQCFDDGGFRAHVGAQLARLRGDASHIGLPAVLGMRHPLDVIADLERHSGGQVFEIATLPPSVPGMRIAGILERAIVAAGGRIQIGSAVLRGVADGDRLTTVVSEAAAREQQHCVARCLLASGGIAGGGVRTDQTGAVWETALGLPLAAPASRRAWFASRSLDPRGHAIFRTGVLSDDRLRPLDQRGVVIYRNVTVAGGALAGADTIRERSRSGVALATGWAAGSRLAAIEA